MTRRNHIVEWIGKDGARRTTEFKGEELEKGNRVDVDVDCVGMRVPATLIVESFGERWESGERYAYGRLDLERTVEFVRGELEAVGADSLADVSDDIRDNFKKKLTDYGGAAGLSDEEFQRLVDSMEQS
jgi:hypothetical protein